MRHAVPPLVLVTVLLVGCGDAERDVPQEEPEPVPVEVTLPVPPPPGPRPPIEGEPARAYELRVPPAWAGPGLPKHMAWSRNPNFYPDGANAVFATSDGCARCHSPSQRALAMRNEADEDISSWGTWRGTMMSQSYVDPYWRAAVAQAIHHEPERREEIESTCLRCHGPMASHTARLSQEPSPPLVDADLDPLAYDGVSCTVCHQALPTNFGDPESFSGRLDIRPGRVIYGPYPEPVLRPMFGESRFVATHGPHIQDAALCGSCHVLEAQARPDAPHFLEQATYLEWRNSAFSTQPEATDTSRTCQQCHMPVVEDTAIARGDGGGDLNILARTDVRSHQIVGGNAFMIDLIRANAEELLVEADAPRLRASAAATRTFLRANTARLAVAGVSVVDGMLRFDLQVENLTGHKLPTGYPARRMWLRVRVRDGEQTLFASGEVDDEGRLVGVADERAVPHRDLVADASQVVVWEMLPTDGAGVVTTVLTAMERVAKDTRILPRGWSRQGPDAALTAAVGTAGDDDFISGSDTVSYQIALADPTPRSLRLEVALLYQPVPPAWVDPLRTVEDEAAERFVRMYDAARDRTETIAELGATLTW